MLVATTGFAGGLQVTPELARILERCGETGAWYDTTLLDVKQTNSMGDTPLHTVCSWGDVAAVEILIKEGADVNARGDRGCTPVFNAVVGQSAEVIKALKRAGADFAIRSRDGRSVLEYAKNIGSSAAVIEALGKK